MAATLLPMQLLSPSTDAHSSQDGCKVRRWAIHLSLHAFKTPSRHPELQIIMQAITPSHPVVWPCAVSLTLWQRLTAWKSGTAAQHKPWCVQAAHISHTTCPVPIHQGSSGPTQHANHCPHASPSDPTCTVLCAAQIEAAAAQSLMRGPSKPGLQPPAVPSRTMGALCEAWEEKCTPSTNGGSGSQPLGQLGQPAAGGGARGAGVLLWVWMYFIYATVLTGDQVMRNRAPLHSSYSSTSHHQDNPGS